MQVTEVRPAPALAIGLALALATVSAAAEPGWLWTRACFPGPPDSITADTAAIRNTSATAVRRALWPSPDTLKPAGGLGSARRLRILRNGQPLLVDQDYRIPSGDSLVVFAARIPAGDSVCLERAYTPLLPRPVAGLYRLDAVPVYRGGVQDSAWQAGTLSAQAADDTAYGKYQLNYSGSKSMAVTVGSGGGLGLDASLFLNLNGQVAEDVFVEGQLSDQNVPIQPEGNTATLKEVDTKFMKVYGSHYSYVLGDYLLDHGVAGEDRYTAKVQGVQGSYSRGGYTARGSWSVSDGQYQSDTLRGVDGKQRGYYLRGRDGRQFITVLAGTERVWRNGVALRRGTDYTIDYSEGRLDFLPPLVVSGENLFAAEYQYTEQEYPRTLAAGEARDSAGALTWSLRAIREAEDGDRPLGGAADTALQRIFRGLGDGVYTDTLKRVVAMPRSQSAAAADLGLKLAGYDGHAALLLSQLDRNLYSDLGDRDNQGYSTRYLGKHGLGRPIDKGGFTRSELAAEHEWRSGEYESFKQLIEPRGFLETWNLDASVARKGFMANRLRLEEKPFTWLSLGGELGQAEADSAADRANPRAGEGSLSRRGGLSAKLGGPRAFLETSTEAKLARSPDRRDNFRQYGHAGLDVAGLTPSFAWTRNEWITRTLGGLLSRSLKQEPEFAIATAPILETFTLGSGISVLSQRSDFGGALPEVQDSVRDWGFQQKASVLGWGPWTSDAFYSYRNHRQWQLDGNGAFADLPVESDFHQVEWNNHVAERKQGYGFLSSYRITQTAELPLVNDFASLPGRGNYKFDSTANTYHEVESGGDFVLVGLKRDTSLSTRPYQDLSWTANLELVPARFPFAVRGVLADVEFTLDLAFDDQDTSVSPGLLPLFTDDQIDEVRSGRARYSPALHWKHPAGGRAANLYVDRSYGRGAGIYAYKELLWSQRTDYRMEMGEDWEGYLEQSYEDRDRSGQSASAASANRNQLYGARLSRDLPYAFLAEGRTQYLRIEGSAPTGDVDLQGVKPALKLEKTSLFNGRAFLEYGVIYFWGQGDGGYYATGDFAKGLTHRAEANANFQVGENIYLNFDYVIRLEPQGKLVQKMTAEARAVF